MEQTERNPAQWLRYLLYIQFASFLLILISYLTPVDTWNTWAQRLLDAAVVYCLFRLAERYRGTAVLHTVTLAVVVASSLLSELWLWQMQQTSAAPDITGYNLVSRVLLVVTIAAFWSADWLLYRAHGQLVPEMERKWRILFFLQLLAAVILSGGSAVLVLLVTDGRIGQELYGKLVSALYIPTRGVDVLSMLYLVRTIHILEKKEE